MKGGEPQVITERHEIALRRWLIAIVAVGVFLRLWGCAFGLPYIYHPDEHNLTYHAMEAAANQGNPGWFEYPSLMMYLFAVLYGIYFLFAYLAGWIDSPSAFYALFQSSPWMFHLIGRICVGMMGALTVLLAYKLGRWTYGRTAGLLAAIFLSVCFLHVRDSHFATVDVPLTLFCTLAIYGAVLGCCQDKSYLLKGAVAAGMATATKYTGVFSLLPLWTACLLLPNNARRQKIKLGAMVCFVSAVVFFLCTPYAILDWESFLRDIGYQFFTTQSSEPIFGGGGSRWLVYLTDELWWGLGLPLELLCIAGVVYALRKRHRADWIVLSFALGYFLFIGAFSRHWGRWILPIVPALIVLGARLWSWEVIQRIAPAESHSPRAKWGSFLLPFATAALVIVPLYRCVRCDALLSRKDTRTLACEYLKERPELKRQTMLVTEFSIECIPERAVSPQEFVAGENARLILENELMRDRPAFAKGQTHQPEIPTFDKILFAREDPQERVGLFVISSFYRDAIAQEHLDKAYPSLETYRNFFAELELRTELLKEFSPVEPVENLPFHVENVYAPTLGLEKMQRPGPRIEIRRPWKEEWYSE